MVRLGRLELPRPFQGTRLSTLHVYHSIIGASSGGPQGNRTPPYHLARMVSTPANSEPIYGAAGGTRTPDGGVPAYKAGAVAAVPPPQIIYCQRMGRGREPPARIPGEHAPPSLEVRVPMIAINTYRVKGTRARSLYGYPYHRHGELVPRVRGLFLSQHVGRKMVRIAPQRCPPGHIEHPVHPAVNDRLGGISRRR